MKKQKKVMAIASGGGHWVQLLRLKPAFDDLNVFYVSMDPSAAADVPGRRFYTIRDASRKELWAFGIVLLQLLRILAKERPQVVITTGSAPALLALLLARKVLRAKTIWIDSIANVDVMSTSGQKARKVADVWLTQWPHLAGKDHSGKDQQGKDQQGPEYWGAVL